MARGQRLRGATTRARRRYRAAKAALASARKTYRIEKGHRARNRAAIRVARGKAIRARRNVLKYEAALAAYRKLIRRPYPHLSGDLDANANVLQALERLAVRIGRNIFVTSGRRSEAEQKRLYDNRFLNPFPVAFCCPCSSMHCLGRAADALVGGAPIQSVVPAATIRAAGLEPLAGDAVHIQI